MIVCLMLAQPFERDTEPFYGKIPLPFPNSSHLLEPSNLMANVKMPIEGYIIALTRPLRYSILSFNNLVS